MSHVDVGKDAKRAGRLHPKHARQIDPVPPRDTPAAKPHRKADKPFGIAYEYKRYRFSGGRVTRVWEPRTMWFKRAAHRDQSLATMLKKPMSWIRKPVKTKRCV